MGTPKAYTDREKGLMTVAAIIGLPILLPFILISCQQTFKGAPPMTAYQSLMYDRCFTEKRDLFKQSWTEADGHCTFWKTAKP